MAFVEHRSAVADFYDEDELRRIYYPEAERLVAEATGAIRVGVFDYTAHSAFEDPTTRADVLPRESIELRTLVFHSA